MDRVSDSDLLRWYHEGAEGEGEAFIAIYARYYVAVIREMEDAGLPLPEAERRVGAVFTWALDRSGPTKEAVPLRKLLLGCAREVARGPQDVPGE